MAVKEKELKVLLALSQLTEPARPSKIGEIVGEKPIDVGRYLAELLKAGLAEKTGDTQNLWTVTEKGAEYLSNLGGQPVSQPRVTGSVTGLCHNHQNNHHHHNHHRNHHLKKQLKLSPRSPTCSGHRTAIGCRHEQDTELFSK